MTRLQKLINKGKGISSIRIRIEHAFLGVKRLKIVKEKISLRADEISDRIMLIATGIHNLRVRFRQLQTKP